MQTEYIVEVSSFKDLHSYYRMRKVSLVLRVLKWTYLEMTLSNLMLHLYMKTSVKVWKKEFPVGQG